jgi:hypothetical protein
MTVYMRSGKVVRNAGGKMLAKSASVPAYVSSAPAGQWTQISTNGVLDAGVKFTGWGSGGYPSDLGNFTDLWGTWCGCAYDPAALVMYFHGGGHSGYNGNEFYAFKLAQNLWARVNNPSPHLESEQVNGLLPDGLPQPIHTYGEIVCDSSGLIYRISNGGSPIANVWRFNPNQATWPFVHNPDTLAAWHDTGAAVSPGYAGGFIYDPVNNKMYGGSITSDFWNGRKFDVATQTMSTIADFPPNGFAPGLYPSVAFDPSRREMVVVGGNDAPASSAEHRGTVTYNVDTNTWASLTSTTTGDKTPETTASGGFDYDSRRDKFWWYGGTPTTKDIFTLTRSTKVWAKISPAGSTPHVPFYQGTYTKFKYIAAYDVIVVVVGDSDVSVVEIWMYKPSDWMA